MSQLEYTGTCSFVSLLAVVFGSDIRRYFKNLKKRGAEGRQMVKVGQTQNSVKRVGKPNISEAQS